MGVGIGGFAQGLAGGLGQGVQIATAIDRDKREQEKFALEKPRLEADAEKAKADLAFQQDFQKNMANLMAEAKGGVVELEDGTTQERPGLDPMDVQLRAAEIMKESMFRHGKLDFAQLKAASEYTKELQAEGVLESMRYAMANPSDQAGIRERFNKKGKLKLGDDVQISIENGDFGPTVVGYKVGADGKPVKAFDGAELLMPYLGAKSFAEMQEKRKLTAFEQNEATKRTGISAGATIESALIGERGATARAALTRSQAGEVTPLEKFKALNASFDKLGENLFRNPLPSVDPYKVTAVIAQARAAASQYMNAGLISDHNVAYQRALAEAFKRAGIKIPAELLN